MDTSLQTLWAERITAYQASGQTMKAWSAEHKVTLHQLKYWLYKAQREGRAASGTTFRPISVGSPSRSGAAESLQIQIGVARINVRSGFEPGLLREIVAALTPLC
jgi:transposase-like protein